jgi:hypothetical protein
VYIFAGELLTLLKARIDICWFGLIDLLLYQSSGDTAIDTVERLSKIAEDVHRACKTSTGGTPVEFDVLADNNVA